MSEPLPPWLADFVLPTPQVPRERRGRWDLFDPETDAARPLIVFVHGGPIPADLPAAPRDWPVFRGYGSLAAAHGVVGMTVDHRLHDTAAYSTAYDDVLGAIEEARSDNRVDPERVCVWLFSGAGPFVAPLLSGPPGWLQCVAATYPVLDSRPGRDPLPVGFEPVEALGALGRAVPFVLTTVGRESEPIVVGVNRFVEVAADTFLDMEVIDHPTGHHGFDSEDYGAASEACVTAGLTSVVRRLTT